MRRRLIPFIAAVALLPLVRVASAEGLDGVGSVIERLGFLFAVSLAFVGGIAYVLGRGDVAKSSWAWAVTVAVIVSLVSGHGVVAPSVGGEVQVFWPPGTFYRHVPVTVVVAGPGELNVVVDWGDGSSSTCSGQGYCVASHVYAEEGVYTVTVAGRSRTIRIVSFGGALEAAIVEGAGGCSIANPLGCVVAGLGRVIGTVTDVVLGVLAGSGSGAILEKIGLMLVTVPETAPPLIDVHSYAWFLLGYAVVGLALWRAFWEFERGLSWLDALREVAFVVLALSLAQPVYAWAAKLVNTISIAMAQPGVLLAWMSMVLAFTAIAAALPVGGAGGLAALYAVGFMGFVFVALLKWLLLEALYLLLPIIAVLWLFPGTRGAARQLTSILVSLMVWNLVIAAMVGLSARALASPVDASPLEVLGYGLAMPLVMLAAGPMVAGLLGAPLPGAGVAQAIITGIAARITTPRPQAAIAAPGAVIGHTEYLKPPVMPAPAVGVAAIAYGTMGSQPATAPIHAEWLRPLVPEVRSGEVVAYRPPRETVAEQALGPVQQDERVAAPEQPRPEEAPPATERVKQAVKEAVKAPVRPVAERVRLEAEAVRQAVSSTEGGRAAKAAALTGAVAARLHAYMSNRARQFVREFAVAFEQQTGIRVPARLKEIRPIEWQRIEERIRLGAEAGAIIGQTIYMKLSKPVQRLGKLIMRQVPQGAGGFRKF